MVNEPRALPVVLVSGALSFLPAGGALQVAWDSIMERRRAYAEQAMREITERVGAERFVARKQSDPTLEALLAAALEALVRSGFEAKRVVLARAVANAYDNDEAVDESALIVDVLARLEPMHIRALARLERAVAEAEKATTDDDRHRIVREVYRAEPIPVLAALIQTGVCIPATVLTGGVAIYNVSPVGSQLLRLLRDVADEDLERLHG
jgi:hypothetical protein